MDSLITKARKQYHEKLLSHNVLTIDKDGVPSNADKSSELSKFIARHIAGNLMAEVHDKIQGQTSGAKFEQINMEFLSQTFPYILLCLNCVKLLRLREQRTLSKCSVFSLKASG